jgi:hypothetical protein
MPWAGFETHYPRNQPAKTHASDRMATVIGVVILMTVEISNRITI